MIPCSISWCVAMTDDRFCPPHKHDQGLMPKTYKRDHVKKHWPPTPWDDEKPWYEDER